MPNGRGPSAGMDPALPSKYLPEPSRYTHSVPLNIVLRLSGYHQERNAGKLHYSCGTENMFQLLKDLVFWLFSIASLKNFRSSFALSCFSECMFYILCFMVWSWCFITFC